MAPQQVVSARKDAIGNWFNHAQPGALPSANSSANQGRPYISGAAAGRIRMFALFAGDVFSFGLSCGLTVPSAATSQVPLWRHVIDQISQLSSSWRGWENVALLAIVVTLIGRRGHYTSRAPFWREVSDILSIAAFVMLCDVFSSVVLLQQSYPPQLLIRWALLIPLMVVMRQVVRLGLTRAGLWRLRTVLVGDNQTVFNVTAALRSEAGLGYDVIDSCTIKDVATDGSAMPWRDLLRNKRADFVIVAINGEETKEGRSAIAALAREQVAYAVMPMPAGLPTLGFTQQSFFSHDVMLLVSNNNLAQPFSRLIKRSADIAVGSLLIIGLSPLLVAIAWMIRAKGGSALFRHERVGAGGRRFKCLKFRTMVPNAAEVLKQALSGNAEAQAEWDATQKLKNDPRITAIGQFLRATSLDELPQLFNVLRGDMSLIGPRPIVADEIARYGADVCFYYEARPGMTGLWQVSGRSETTYERRVQLDSWYVKNWSLRHDVAIALKTLPAVLGKRGAV